MSCTSATDCTAVGSGPDLNEPVYATETAGTWGALTPVIGVPTGFGDFSSVSCTDATDCTAGGAGGNLQPIYATETAGTWGTPTEVAGSPADSVFASVSCTDATDCTAVGYVQGTGEPIYATETAGTWGTTTEVTDAPGGEGFLSVSCTDATDCTAVGYDGNNEPIYATETAGTWGTPTEVAGSPSGVGVLSSVSCTDATDCTAVGYGTATAQGTSEPFYVTETAGTWGAPTQMARSSTEGDVFRAVSCTDAGDCTTVGVNSNSRPIFDIETDGTWGTPTSDVNDSLVFKVSRVSGLWGHFSDHVSGTDPNPGYGDSATIYECATSYYTTPSCDSTNDVRGAVGSGGGFTTVPISLDVGVIDAKNDTCGLVNSTECYLVAVFSTDDTTSVPLSFTAPSLALKKSAATLGNYVDGVKAAWFPSGDTITAEECDASVAVPSSIANDCDAATQISGVAGAGGKVAFSPSGIDLLVGDAFSDAAAGACLVGSACEIVVTDTDNPAIALSTSVDFGSPTIAVKNTTAVLGNTVDTVKAAGFPIGDTVTAEECDSSVAIPGFVSADCDASTQITGTVATSGKVIFSPTGVTLREGGAYSDPSAGTCASGGTCDIVVQDSENSAVALSEAITLASPMATATETTAVAANYVDKITARAFPIGDNVVAEECDSGVDPATNLATSCDPATAITGTVAASGTVAFRSTGVAVKEGASYTEEGAGIVVAGGSAAIVVTDTTSSGISVVVPISLA